MTTTLIEYSREIMPKLQDLAKLKGTLKDWADNDEEVQEHKREIKAAQENLKGIIEEKESNLIREIKDLETDIKLACKAASKKVVTYSAAELKGYFVSRSKDKVDDVINKGVSFGDLDNMLK